MIRSAVKSLVACAGRLEGVAAGAVPAETDRAPIDADAVRNVLILTMDRLGDLVRATPAIRSVGRYFHRAEVTLVAPARSAPILRENPWIGRHQQIDDPFSFADHRRTLRALRGTSWDLGVLLEVDPYWTTLEGWWLRRLGVPRWVCFDFERGVSPRARGVPLGARGSWIDQFNRLAAATGADPDDGPTEVHLTADERAEAARLLADSGIDAGGGFFLIHPGGNFLTVSRQWSPRSFARLVDLIRARWPHPIAVTGIERERPVLDQITEHTRVPLVDLVGRLKIRQLAGVIEQSMVCIMNDTGPLHIAHALGRPSVALLGPTAPEVVGIPAATLVARADLPCSPCAFHTGWKACTNPTRWECLSALTPEHVFERLVQLMARSARRAVLPQS